MGQSGCRSDWVCMLNPHSHALLGLLCDVPHVHFLPSTTAIICITVLSCLHLLLWSLTAPRWPLKPIWPLLSVFCLVCVSAHLRHYLPMLGFPNSMSDWDGIQKYVTSNLNTKYHLTPLRWVNRYTYSLELVHVKRSHLRGLFEQPSKLKNRVHSCTSMKQRSTWDYYEQVLWIRRIFVCTSILMNL